MILADNEQSRRAALAASFQRAVVDVLVAKSRLAYSALAALPFAQIDRDEVVDGAGHLVGWQGGAEDLPDGRIVRARAAQAFTNLVFVLLLGLVL